MDKNKQKAVLYESPQAKQWREQAVNKLMEQRKREGNTIETTTTTTTKDEYGRITSVKRTVGIETHYTHPK